MFLKIIGFIFPIYAITYMIGLLINIFTNDKPLRALLSPEALYSLTAIILIFASSMYILKSIGVKNSKESV